MATHVPPSPQLSGNSTLEVFVHHTSSSAEGGRLRLLGKSQLKMAYTAALDAKYPNLGGNELSQYVSVHYQDFVAHWVTAYGWRTMLWAVPHGVNLNDPAESNIIFETYAGAVVGQSRQPGGGRSDPAILMSWICDLVAIYG